MLQRPHDASAFTSQSDKISDVVTNNKEFFIIVLEDDSLLTPKDDCSYEKIMNEEAFVFHLFEKRSFCISEYEKAKETYATMLHENKINNESPYLLDSAARYLDAKRQDLYEIDNELKKEISMQTPASSVSKIATSGNNLKEIILACKDGGTKKTLVRSQVMRNHMRTYKLRTKEDLGKGGKSFIKNNKVDWDELKSQYKLSNASVKLKSDMPWVGDWIKNCNKDVVMVKYAAQCNNEIDVLGISSGFDFSAEAQFFRAATSLAWTYENDLRKGKFNTRIDGGVSCTLVEAKSAASFVSPRDGIMLRCGDIYLGIIRISIIVSGSAGAGAAIAGSLFVDIDASGGKISELPSTVRSIRSTEPGQVKDLSKLPGGKAGLSGSAFLGVSVDASIAGALEWKSPEVIDGKENAFKALATIKPGLSATAGIGAELEYYFDFTDGVFRIFCKAALCIGIGAKGNIGFEVNANQIGNFIICAYHQICSSKGFVYSKRALSAITLLTINGLIDNINDIYDMTSLWYENALQAWEDENNRIKIMKNIIKDPDILKYTVPSAKGLLVHFLMNSSWWANYYYSNNFDEWKDLRKGSTPRKRAIILIFTWVQSKEEFREVMSNVKENALIPDISWEEGFEKVKAFLDEGEWFDFAAPYISSDYDNNLSKFYEHLHEQHPVGYPVIRNDMKEYLARNEISPTFSYPLLHENDFKIKMLAQAKELNDNNNIV